MKNISSFSFIFVGDTHGFIDDYKKQQEIIIKVKPDYVLFEQLQNNKFISKKDYQLVFKKHEISNAVKFKDVKKLLCLCSRLGIKMIGIDLKNFGLSERLQRIVSGKIKPNEKDMQNLNEILKERQNHHLDIIKRYKTKTNKPIIVIVGAWHLKNNSLLMKHLNNYLVIYPCDKSGNAIYGNIKGKGIHYRERIKR